jgi:hypothetical protein
MNVSGIRPYEGFYQYNSIKLNEIRNRQMQENTPEQEQEPKIESQALESAPLNQSFGSYDFAQLYQADDTFTLKGIDSDLGSLDAEKAVSDLDKDQILQQYQYFVGDRQTAAGQQAQTENILRTGENFSL